MLDRYNRKIHYLRISVTGQCNFRCVYCIPDRKTVDCIPKDQLTQKEIFELVNNAVPLGFNKFRLTGGEPLMREDIIKLVSGISAVPGVKDFAMTTNGAFLAKFAKKLKTAGLHRLNVSLDSVDPRRFKKITGGGNLDNVLDGLNEAQKVGFKKIKINCVIRESPDEPDAVGVGDYGKKHGFEVRYIREMNFKEGKFWPIFGGIAGHCTECNRIRVSCVGDVFPCLFSDIKFNLREIGILEALKKAINAKPEKGHSPQKLFYQIGG